MKRHVIQTKDFDNAVENLITKRKLNRKDFVDFKRALAENPEQGDVIPGTGGIRKSFSTREDRTQAIIRRHQKED